MGGWVSGRKEALTKSLLALEPKLLSGVVRPLLFSSFQATNFQDLLLGKIEGEVGHHGMKSRPLLGPSLPKRYADKCGPQL